MYKVIGIHKRADGVSLEDFSNWWLREHAPLVAKLPGIRRYTVSIGGGDDRFDGLAEAWFDSRQAIASAFSSPMGEAVRAHSNDWRTKEHHVFIVEEHVIVAGSLE